MDGGMTLAPWVGVGGGLRDPVAVEQRVDVTQHRLAHELDADALEVAVGALEVLRVLPVVLEEREREPDRLTRRRHGREQVALAPGRARRAPDVELPPALDR